MTSSEAIDQIESDRRRREKELLLLLLLLSEESMRHAFAAVRLGHDPYDAIATVWSGSERLSLKGAIGPIARAMADAHEAGRAMAEKIAGAPSEPLRLYESPFARQALADIYHPAAQSAADSMLDTLLDVLRASAVGVPPVVKDEIAALRVGFGKGYTLDNPYALARGATQQILLSFNFGMYAGMIGPMGLKILGYRHISVLDNRTTEICNERNGLTLAKDDPYWLSNYPPLHMNCRSIVLPIRRAMEWDTAYPLTPPAPGFGQIPSWLPLDPGIGRAA